MDHELDYKVLFKRLKKDYKILEDKYENILIELINIKNNITIK